MSSSPNSGAPTTEGWAATHWGTYKVRAQDGEVLDVSPAPGDNDPSSIGDNLRGALRSKSRVLRPAVRRGGSKTDPAPATNEVGSLSSR